jgi:hypothetical protein
MTMNITQTTATTAQFKTLLELPVTGLIQLVNQAYETEAIAYWVAYARDAERGEPDEDGYPNCYQFNLEAEDDEETYHVDVNTIRNGIQLLLTGKAEMMQGRKYVLQALIEQDLGYIDSDVLDMIVQAGLFGELVYG